MNTYKRHRSPPEIISYAVWLYYQFSPSHRDIEDLLAERGVTVSHESIRLWCNKFGPIYTRRLKRKRQGYGDTFYIDEVFVKINGELQSASSGGSKGPMALNLGKSSLTNCAVTMWLTGILSPRPSVKTLSMPTTRQSYRTNPLGFERDKCAGSSHQGKRSVS
jgi:hypothetical protein